VASDIADHHGASTSQRFGFRARVLPHFLDYGVFRVLAAQFRFERSIQ